MELIDVFDANLNPLGIMQREQAHREGQWHRSVHLWLAGRAGGGKLLFQLRGPDVSANPGLLDASAAGHVMAGEDVTEGLREAREELGVEVPVAVHHLGYRTEAADLPNGDLNREYQAIFLAETPFQPADFSPDPAEVHGLFAIAISGLFALFGGEIDDLDAEGIAYDPAVRGWRSESRRFHIASFVPRIPHYYVAVAIMAERLLERRLPLAIG
jgi:isopentenyldiphosphate isomerase